MSQNNLLLAFYKLHLEESEKYHSVSDVYDLLETNISYRAVSRSVKKLFKSDFLEMDFRSFLSSFVSSNRAIPKYRINRSKLRYIEKCLKDLSKDERVEVSDIPTKGNCNIRNKDLVEGSKCAIREVLNDFS